MADRGTESKQELQSKQVITYGAREAWLLEAAATGDVQSVQALLTAPGLFINGQHAMNGWTALHWASKRNHASIVRLLLSYGADANLRTTKGETALQLTTSSEVRTMLGGDSELKINSEQSSLPIIPHYILNPVFPYATSVVQQPTTVQFGSATSNLQPLSQIHVLDASAAHISNSDTFSLANCEEITVRARVADAKDDDYIEVDIVKPRQTVKEHSSVYFDRLVSTLCSELDVERDLIRKVRKDFNTIVRNDRDVKRLTSKSCLELVLKR